MASKRQPVASKRPSARRAPVRTEQLYSSDEKRQLILAHAAMRTPQDPIQMMSVWAGVAIALLVIGMGWWWSSGSLMIHNAGRIAPEAKNVLTDVSQAYPEAKSEGGLTEMLHETSDKLRVLSAEAATRQQAIDHMAQLVASSTDAESRDTIFRPE